MGSLVCTLQPFVEKKVEPCTMFTFLVNICSRWLTSPLGVLVSFCFLWIYSMCCQCIDRVYMYMTVHIAILLAGFIGSGLSDCLGGLPRVLGVVRASLPDSRGLHDGQHLPLTWLHAAPGHLVHAVGPGEVSPRLDVQLMPWRSDTLWYISGFKCILSHSYILGNIRRKKRREFYGFKGKALRI